jgi:hypothetical protein
MEEKPKAAPSAKWEYRLIDLAQSNVEAEKVLNQLGEENWEVVGMGGDVSAQGSRQGSGTISTKIRVILKRPKP